MSIEISIYSETLAEGEWHSAFPKRAVEHDFGSGANCYEFIELFGSARLSRRNKRPPESWLSPIVESRGLPSDCSLALRTMFEKEAGKEPSWLLLSELVDYLNDNRSTLDGWIVDILDKNVRKLSKLGEFDRVRIVLWFDGSSRAL